MLNFKLINKDKPKANFNILGLSELSLEISHKLNINIWYFIKKFYLSMTNQRYIWYLKKTNYNNNLINKQIAEFKRQKYN